MSAFSFLFFIILLMLSGCSVKTGCMSAELPATKEALTVGTLENPVIDSNITLPEALRKEAPLELKAKQELVEVLYCSFDGRIHKGQVVIDYRLAEDIKEIFRVVLESRFPIGSAIPISHDKFYKDGKWNEDDLSMLSNNSSGFNYRNATGSKKLSQHAYGFAIDINPVQNPYIKGDIILPAAAVYDPQKPGTLSRDCPVVKAFLRLGWRWGGDWKSLKDYMHFEKEPDNIE